MSDRKDCELYKDIIKWLLSNDTGDSSMAIVSCFMGFEEPKYGYNHPRDPSDFGRCVRLLALIPEIKTALPKIAQTGQRWANLYEHWDEITKVMEEEVGLNCEKGRRAEKTYDLIVKYTDTWRK